MAAIFALNYFWIIQSENLFELEYEMDFLFTGLGADLMKWSYYYEVGTDKLLSILYSDMMI